MPLEKLIHDYDIYSKLKKIHYFKYYSLIKFMNKWNRGSKMAKFIENKFKIRKLLYLDTDKILPWKIELKNILYISDKGGHLNSGWVKKVATGII